jgi:arachidonate 15-lipoxygenase (second type) / 8-lipoxygenase (S-type)
MDLMFPYTGDSARSYSTNRYKYAGVGKFQSNYFTADLTNRGLLGSSGPALKSLPFYQDGSILYNAMQTFMTTFVNSYYSSDAAVAADSEIQNWVAECNGPAQVFDFPSQITTTATLVDVLTHIVSFASLPHDLL